MPACKNSSPRKPIPTKTNLEATNYLSCLETYQWDRETQLRSLCVLVSLQGHLYVDENSIGFSKPCFLFHHLWMFDELIQEHFNGTWLEVMEATYMDLCCISIYHIYISYISYIYIYICTYVCSLYPISIDIHFPPVRFVQCESEFEESGNRINGKQRHHTYRWFISFFSCFFSPCFYSIQSDKKRCSRRIGVFFFFFVFSHFAVFVASCHVAAPPVSRHLCTQEEFYQGYSRLVNFTEVSAGWRRAVVRCGLSWSHDCDELSFNKRTRKRHKSFKIFTFEVCGKFFHWSLELSLNLDIRFSKGCNSWMG